MFLDDALIVSALVAIGASLVAIVLTLRGRR